MQINRKVDRMKGLLYRDSDLFFFNSVVSIPQHGTSALAQPNYPFLTRASFYETMNTTFFVPTAMRLFIDLFRFFCSFGGTSDDAFCDRKRQEKEGRLDGVQIEVTHC